MKVRKVEKTVSLELFTASGFSLAHATISQEICMKPAAGLVKIKQISTQGVQQNTKMTEN